MFYMNKVLNDDEEVLVTICRVQFNTEVTLYIIFGLVQQCGHVFSS